ncbi:MAG: class B sortase [Oscillospiraceae bacterium]
MTKKAVNISIAVLLGIATLCAAGLAVYAFSAKQQREQFDTLSQSFWDEAPISKAPSASVKESSSGQLDAARLESLALLKEQNSDLAGWIYIPGTAVNYPVMQTPDDPEFYIKRNFEKKYSSGGVPFADARCSVSPPSANLVIYGHNMKDGSMFSDLEKYKTREYYTEHPDFYFYTPSGAHKYQIIGAIQTSVYNDEKFDFYSFIENSDENTLAEYVKKVQDEALYPLNVAIPENGRLITLSTCSYHEKNGRFLVIGVRIEDNSPLQISGIK